VKGGKSQRMIVFPQFHVWIAKFLHVCMFGLLGYSEWKAEMNDVDKGGERNAGSEDARRRSSPENILMETANGSK